MGDSSSDNRKGREKSKLSVVIVVSITLVTIVIMVIPTRVKGLLIGLGVCCSRIV